MNSPEHDIQVGFVVWCAMHRKRYPGLERGFAVPNGGHRSKATAGKLKAEGVRPGVLDWYCPKRRHPYVGLVIEFKAPGKYPTPAQKDELLFLSNEGWSTHVCWSIDEGIAAVRDYFGP